MTQQKNFDIPTTPRDLYQSEHTTTLGAEDIVAYVASNIEYVPWKGIIIHIEDATYPKKGFPTPEAVAAINIIKVILRECLKLKFSLLVANKNTLLNSFNIIFDKTFLPYKLKEEYLCPTAYNFYKFLQYSLIDLGITPSIAGQTAFNIAHILEYDDAYRYRFQDLMSEFIVEANPRQEMKRLLNIFTRRTRDNVSKKLAHILMLVPLLLLVPRYKKIFNNNKAFLKKCAFDEADRYWAYLKNANYDFGGEEFPQRTEGMKIPQPYKINM